MCWLRKQLSVAYYFLFGRIWTMNKWTTTTRSTEYTFTMRTSSLEKRLRVHIIPWITFFPAICMSYLFSIFSNTFLFHFAIIIFFSPLSFWVSSKTIMTFFTFPRMKNNEENVYIKNCWYIVHKWHFAG